MLSSNQKKARVIMMIATAAVMLFSIAGAVDFNKVSEPIVKLIDSLLYPILGIVGAGGTIYCVSLGVKYAKAEEPQEREKAKTHLQNAIIGFALIFILIVALKILMPQLIDWMEETGASSSSGASAASDSASAS